VTRTATTEYRLDEAKVAEVTKLAGVYEPFWSEFVATLKEVATPLTYGDIISAARVHFHWHGYPSRMVDKAIWWGALALVPKKPAPTERFDRLSSRAQRREQARALETRCVTCGAGRSPDFQECNRCHQKRCKALGLEAAA
jgi:hypothetical protein